MMGIAHNVEIRVADFYSSAQSRTGLRSAPVGAKPRSTGPRAPHDLAVVGRVERSIEISGRQQRTITRFYNAQGDVTATMSVTKIVKKKSGLPKKTPYNYKQLSTQLMRARTSGEVSQVLIKMRNKRAQLISAKRSGDYDDTEIVLAIIHAEEIEQVARKRKKNLEMEERAEITQESAEYEEQLEKAADPLGLFGEEDINSRKPSEEEMEQILSDLEEEMNELMKEMEDNAEMDEALEEMTEVFSADMSAEDLEEMKKRHRAAEQCDIIKADMKYLKALFDKLSRDKEHAASASGVYSSADAAPISAPVVAAQSAIMPEQAPVSPPVSPEGQMIDVPV